MDDLGHMDLDYISSLTVPGPSQTQTLVTKSLVVGATVDESVVGDPEGGQNIEGELV